VMMTVAVVVLVGRRFHDRGLARPRHAPKFRLGS
jgi:hypothetical protein